MNFDKRMLTKIFDMIMFHIRTRYLQTEERTGAEISASLKKAIPIYGTDKMIRVAFDSKYYVTSKEDFERLAKINPVDKIPYKKEKFDCDNFARLFSETMSLSAGINSIGIVVDHSGGHAYNVVIFKNGEVGFWEPQSDRWVEIGEVGSLYELSWGIIIL